MIRYALLGLIQGLTEFLPVSSSGHLVIGERLLGLRPPGVLLEAFLHLGTLGAVLWVFRADLAELAQALTRRGTIERRKEIGFLVAGTIPIVVAGLLFRPVADAVFSSLAVVGGGLLFTALVLVAAERLRTRATRHELRFVDSLVVGIAQAVALLPGVSRSGATISAGVSRRIEPSRAARFSFLLSIPALLGAGLLSLWDAATGGGWSGDWGGIAVGTAVAFVVGILGVHALLSIVRRSRLWFFSIYCACVGLSVLVFDLL
jgi:undecaprenyl-diphosphatase